MAENQLPVLTLDFSDEKIKKLEEIAEKFKAGFAIGPGGFPVTEQKAIPGNNSQPQRIKATESTFDKFMKSLDKEGKATLKTFTLIDKTLQQTTSTLKGLFSTTISWGVKIAGLAAGSSFFGYDMLAKHAADQLKLFQGLNMSPGQVRAADSVYGSRFSSVGEVEQVLAKAQSDPTSKEYAAISSFGLNPALGASQNLPLFYQKMDEYQKRYGANALAALEGSGLGWFGTSYLNEVKANSDILPILPQQYAERSKMLDSALGTGTLQSLQNLSSTFDNNGDQIVFTFLNALKTLNPAITSLSNTLTVDIDQFIKGNGKAVFSEIATGLTKLGDWLNSDKFKADMTDFEKAIEDVAHAVGSAAKWILKISGDDGGDDDKSGSWWPWALGGAYVANQIGGPVLGAWGGYAGYLYGDRQNIGDSATSSWDYIKQNIGNGLRWFGFDTGFGLPYGTVNGNNIQSDIPGNEPEQHAQSAHVHRGIRNNNPGNLKFVHQRGAVLEDGPDPSHAKFATMAMGLAALDRQVELDIKRGKDTIDEIFSSYSTKNKKEYKAYVSQVTGLGLNERIDAGNRDEIVKMLRGIITMENGSQARQITDKELQLAYNANHPIQRDNIPRQTVSIDINTKPGSDIAASVKGINQYPG